RRQPAHPAGRHRSLRLSALAAAAAAFASSLLPSNSAARNSAEARAVGILRDPHRPRFNEAPALLSGKVAEFPLRDQGRWCFNEAPALLSGKEGHIGRVIPQTFA